MIEYIKTYKLLIIGDKDCGKTSIVDRYINDTFRYDVSATIGVNFDIKYLQIKGNNIKLHIWDLSGDNKFRVITASYYNDNDGVIFVFDKSNIKSLYNIDEWVKNYKNNNNIKFNAILVGTKEDKLSFFESAKVDEEALIYSRKNGIDKYISCSAKSGRNIYEIYNEIIDMVYVRDNMCVDKKYLNNDIHEMKGCCKYL